MGRRYASPNRGWRSLASGTTGRPMTNGLLRSRACERFRQWSSNCSGPQNPADRRLELRISTHRTNPYCPTSSDATANTASARRRLTVAATLLVAPCVSPIIVCYFVIDSLDGIEQLATNYWLRDGILISVVLNLMSAFVLGRHLSFRAPPRCFQIPICWIFLR